jgi:hypothetical protein
MTILNRGILKNNETKITKQYGNNNPTSFTQKKKINQWMPRHQLFWLDGQLAIRHGHLRISISMLLFRTKISILRASVIMEAIVRTVHN